MPFSIRSHRRFPVNCRVTYHAGLHEGSGTVWSVSLTGWLPVWGSAAIVPNAGTNSGVCV